MNRVGLGNCGTAPVVTVAPPIPTALDVDAAKAQQQEKNKQMMVRLAPLILTLLLRG